MDDLIKRSEAIDAIRQWVKMHQYYHPHSKGKTIPVDEAIDELERVQAEQPAPQGTGWWEPVVMQTNNEVVYRCLGCDKLVWFATNYCPHCGSRNYKREDCKL